MTKLYFAFLWMIFGFSIQAQATDFWLVLDKNFEEGVDLFDKKMYSAAHQKMQHIIDKISDHHHDLQVHAEYYLALSSDQLFNRDANYYLLNFIQLHPEYSRIDQIYFALANIQFRKKEYPEALINYDAIRPKSLSENQKIIYQFNKAYSQLETKKNALAKELFYELSKDTTHIYYKQSLYYYSYILYQEGFFVNALEGFKKLEKEPEFAQAVPFQIFQIYLHKKQYKEALEYLDQHAELANAYGNEIIMEGSITAAFEQKDYKRTESILTQYEKAKGTLSRENYYLMAYLKQKSNNISLALHYYNLVKTEKDNLSQLVYYYSAICYLKLKKNDKAQEAFQLAYQLGNDPKIAENALLNRAKLMYENPKMAYIDDIELTLQAFIQEYPNSKHIDDVYSLLAFFYLNSNDYAQAKKSLDNIPNKNIKLKMVYQFVCYNYGIELYHQKAYQLAIIQLNLAAQTFNKNADQKIENPVFITALASYWAGVSAYKIKDYSLAETYLNTFKKTLSAYTLEEFNRANYQLGYIYYEQDHFTEAIDAFVTFVGNKKENDKERLSDAYMRLGDAYYALHNLEQALSYYQKAAENTKTRDYALLQQAILNGEKSLYALKEELLNSILSNYPKTQYKGDVLFELADVNRFLNKKEKAIAYYKDFILTYPYHPKNTKAKIELSLLYYKDGKAQLAANEIQQLIESVDLGDQLSVCITILEEIYVELGKTQELKVWMEKKGLQYRSEQVDILAYNNAKKQYFAKNYQKSVALFEQYFKNNTNPSNKFSALFLLADSYLQLKDTLKAMNKLDEIVLQDKGIYKISALKLLSDTYIAQNKKLKAIDYLKQELDISTDLLRNFQINAFLGRYYFDQKEYNLAIFYGLEALKIEKNQGAFEEIYLIIAWSKYNSGSKSEALPYLEKLNLSKTKSANEAKYLEAQINFDLQDLNKTEQYLDELFKKKPAYKYWTAKGYLLMSDVLMQKKEWDEAKLTLESILNGYKQDAVNRNMEDDILLIASNKMLALEQHFKKPNAKKIEDLQLNIDNEQAEKNKKLYQD